MKLTTNTQVSVDGVVQANGAPEQNGRHALDCGGWARPLFDDQAMAFVNEFCRRADAFLFGRRTYDPFAGYWGVKRNLENPIVGALNTKPRYIASRSLTDAQWANTTVRKRPVSPPALMTARRRDLSRRRSVTTLSGYRRCHP